MDNNDGNLGPSFVTFKDTGVFLTGGRLTWNLYDVLCHEFGLTNHS